jgi:hypothetical protein
MITRDRPVRCAAYAHVVPTWVLPRNVVSRGDTRESSGQARDSCHASAGRSARLPAPFERIGPDGESPFHAPEPVFFTASERVWRVPLLDSRPTVPPGQAVSGSGETADDLPGVSAFGRHRLRAGDDACSEVCLDRLARLGRCGELDVFDILEARRLDGDDVATHLADSPGMRAALQHLTGVAASSGVCVVAAPGRAIGNSLRAFGWPCR